MQLYFQQTVSANINFVSARSTSNIQLHRRSVEFSARLAPFGLGAACMQLMPVMVKRSITIKIQK